MAVPTGHTPRMDRHAYWRGLYKRGRPPLGIRAQRFPRFVLQRAVLHQEAAGLGGQEV